MSKKGVTRSKSHRSCTKLLVKHLMLPTCLFRLSPRADFLIWRAANDSTTLSVNLSSGNRTCVLSLPSQATAVGPPTVLTFDDFNRGAVNSSNAVRVRWCELGEQHGYMGYTFSRPGSHSLRQIVFFSTPNRVWSC